MYISLNRFIGDEMARNNNNGPFALQLHKTLLHTPQCRAMQFRMQQKRTCVYLLLSSQMFSVIKNWLLLFAIFMEEDHRNFPILCILCSLVSQCSQQQQQQPKKVPRASFSFICVRAHFFLLIYSTK